MPNALKAKCMCSFDKALLLITTIIIIKKKYGTTMQLTSCFIKWYSHPNLISIDSVTPNKNKQKAIPKPPKSSADQTFTREGLGQENDCPALQSERPGAGTLRVWICLVVCFSNFLFEEHKNWRGQLPLKPGENSFLRRYTLFFKGKDDPSLTRLLDGHIKPDSKPGKIKYYLD